MHARCYSRWKSTIDAASAVAQAGNDISVRRGFRFIDNKCLPRFACADADRKRSMVFLHKHPQCGSGCFAYWPGLYF